MRPVALALAVLLAAPILADAQLVLRDGTLVKGESLERKDTLYLLKQKDGTVVTVPVDLVKELRLIEEATAAPSGIKLATPKTLAGASQEPPAPGGPEKQLAAFGRPPAPPRRGPVPTEWTPTDSLQPDVVEFSPARWYKAPIDPTWTPKPAYTNATDVTNFNPARWYRSPFDPTWTPTDGFARSRPTRTPEVIRAVPPKPQEPAAPADEPSSPPSVP